MYQFKRVVCGAALVASILCPLAGCEYKGPAERAGEKVDNAARDIKDAVDPPSGPAEQAGRSVDRALNK